jgi:hypothetical protein
LTNTMTSYVNYTGNRATDISNYIINAVPEPSSLLLLLLSANAIFIRRRQPTVLA